MMREFKGTAGEWIVKGRKPIEGDVHLLFADVNSKGEGYLVGGICVWDDDKDSAQEAVCNAHLIAAAPDLLGALQFAITEIEARVVTEGDALMTNKVLRQARAAIAKALGETK